MQETNKYRRSLETLVHGGGGKVVGIGAGGIAFADALAKIGETNIAKNSGAIPALQPSEDHLADLKVRACMCVYECVLTPHSPTLPK